MNYDCYGNVDEDQLKNSNTEQSKSGFVGANDFTFDFSGVAGADQNQQKQQDLLQIDGQKPSPQTFEFDLSGADQSKATPGDKPAQGGLQFDFDAGTAVPASTAKPEIVTNQNLLEVVHKPQGEFDFEIEDKPSMNSAANNTFGSGTTAAIGSGIGIIGNINDLLDKPVA